MSRVGRNLKDGDRMLKRLTGAEILIGLAGLQHARVSDLMTGHANVVGQLTAQTRGVDDGGVCNVSRAWGDLAFAHGVNMRGAGTMTVLAAY